MESLLTGRDNGVMVTFTKFFPLYNFCHTYLVGETGTNSGHGQMTGQYLT